MEWPLPYMPEAYITASNTLIAIPQLGIGWRFVGDLTAGCLPEDGTDKRPLISFTCSHTHLTIYFLEIGNLYRKYSIEKQHPTTGQVVQKKLLQPYVWCISFMGHKCAIRCQSIIIVAKDKISLPLDGTYRLGDDYWSFL